jgi:hypothetical protein
VQGGACETMYHMHERRHCRCAVSLRGVHEGVVKLVPSTPLMAAPAFKSTEIT